jgi:hypothetical protein
MKYEEFCEKIGKHVIVETYKDGIFKGKFTNTESEFDTSSGEEEIELYIDDGISPHYIGIEFSAIKAMVLA